MADRGAHARPTRRPVLTPQRLPLAVVGLAVAFGLWSLRSELVDVWSLNDASIHASMVRWAAARVRAGHLPFDGWYPYLSLGSSRFHHYQSLPHILTGAVSVVTGPSTFRWSMYLLLASWPVSVYAGGRFLGLGRWPAAAAALLSPLLVSEPGLGYEWGSYLWRGSGTWAQLWGMWALPLAWGLAWRAVARGHSIALAAVVVGVTVALHLLTGYLALLSLGVFVVATPREFVRRGARAALVGLGAMVAAAWMVVPLVLDAAWTIQDEFSLGTIYYDSFGAGRIGRWAVSGELFDRGRLPLISILVAVGLVTAAVGGRRREAPRVILGLGLLSLVLFFGRPTLGPVIDLLPGGGDLFLRRYISGVHLAGLYLGGLGLVRVVSWTTGLVRNRWSPDRRWVVAALTVAMAGVLIAPAIAERTAFARRGARWVEEQRVAEATDGAGYEALVRQAQRRGPGRIFSDRRSSAPSYRVGQVPAFAIPLNLDADSIGFTRPTWSLASGVEARFSITDPDHPSLFGVRYLILDEDRQPPPGASELARAGRHVLWEMPDVGYLSVVDTIAPIEVDRTNLGIRMDSYLTSGLIGQAMHPTLGFGGRMAAEPTLGPDRLPAGSPGVVVEQAAGPAEGLFAGTVEATRSAVVLLKASYDPRWIASVDGHPVPLQIVAPGFVGAPVSEGRHEVVFVYRSFPRYDVLLAIGVAWIVVLALGERAVRRRTPR